jgi:hypothetical protein
MLFPEKPYALYQQLEMAKGNERQPYESKCLFAPLRLQMIAPSRPQKPTISDDFSKFQDS